MALYLQSPTRNLPDGFTFRGATIKDIPVIAQLFNQRQLPSSGGYATIDEMRKEWQSSMIKPAIDVRLVLDRREQVVGYIEVWTSTSLGAHPWLWGCVHPAFEGLGIGTALLRWAEARVRLALEVLPPRLMVAPRFGTSHDLKTAAALCKALGWQIVRQPEGILPQVRSLASAQHLATGNGPAAGYDVYEKMIRPGDEFIPEAV